MSENIANFILEMALFERVPDDLLKIMLNYGDIQSVCLIPEYYRVINFVREQINMTIIIFVESIRFDSIDPYF